MNRRDMKKKLIEVALPLEAINKASAKEKSIRHAHPSTLHFWRSRKPLATCRAVLFASLVDDPSCDPERFPTEGEQDRERQRLFRLVEEFVKWENSNDPNLLSAAQEEILRSTGGNPPTICDPFCGGGSIPLEAQRLGLEVFASDLNPVAVLITKALIEIPPRFSSQPPINPTARRKMTAPGLWAGARGLGEDVRYYGDWMRNKAEERIGKLYPQVIRQTGQQAIKATVIAWLWARTVRCPNPACGANMPLASKFWLSTKPGQKTWVEPVIDHAVKSIHFSVRSGETTPQQELAIENGTSTVNVRGKREKASFLCPVCKVGHAKGSYIDEEANASRMGVIPLAIVAEGLKGRVYLDFDEEKAPEQFAAIALSHQLASSAVLKSRVPSEACRGTFASNAQGRTYGFKTFADYFTERQLVVLDEFSGLVDEARGQAVIDGATKEYAEAIAAYLGIVVSKATMFHNSLARWRAGEGKSAPAFGQQGLQMVWEFAEINPFAGAGGDLLGVIDGAVKLLSTLGRRVAASVEQLDAATALPQKNVVFCTDPPYYDNVSYADLSDFFYVWMRKSLAAVFPELFSTLLTPKVQELVVTPHRFGGDIEKAEDAFETGLQHAFAKMREYQRNDYPVAVFYAFKQSESDDEDSGPAVIASTGWETMLQALLGSGFQVTGTWPIRTENATRMVAMGSNALASSIVLICRPLPELSGVTTRKDFLSSLKKELPPALRNLQKGNIAPVDLAQAAIGPGMAVFSRYKKVLETDGSPMRVRTALALINQGLDEVLSELESEFDPDTRWALAWFEQHQFDEGLYGEAEVLATAKALSISHLAEAGILHSRAGKVRLLRREELPTDWDPSSLRRLTVWEVTQHLIRRLDQKGEAETANLKAKIGGMAEIARDLAYRLYTLCERKGWAEEAGYYNSLVVAWPSMASEAFELK